MNMFVHTQLWFCVEWKFVPFTPFTHLLCCELVHSQLVSCLWMNIFVHTEHWFCVEWKFVPSFTCFTHLLRCELVHSQHVSCLSMNMFVHTQHWFCVEWKFVDFTSFTLLLCCELVHSGCKLPLKEHLCAYATLILCWVKIRSFYLLCPLAVLWTGASARTLPLNEHVLCKVNIDFVLSENSFLLPFLPTCCVVNWCTLSL